jgi:cytochrome c556
VLLPGGSLLRLSRLSRGRATQPAASTARPLSAGELPFDHEVVRQAAGLTRRLPAVDSLEFGADYTTVGTGCPAAWQRNSL